MPQIPFLIDRRGMVPNAGPARLQPEGERAVLPVLPEPQGPRIRGDDADHQILPASSEYRAAAIRTLKVPSFNSAPGTASMSLDSGTPRERAKLSAEQVPTTVAPGRRATPGGVHGVVVMGVGDQDVIRRGTPELPKAGSGGSGPPEQAQGESGG